MAVVLSSSEMLGLVGELYTRRMSMVLGKAAKDQKKPLNAFLSSLPDHTKEGIKTVNRLHKAYERGDYRHDESDVGRIEALANFLIETHQRLGNHPEVRPVKFEPHTMTTKIPCMPHTYEECLITTRQQIG